MFPLRTLPSPPDNSAREFDQIPLINSTDNAFIGITIQYRLGVFGFLAHPNMAKSNGLNAGITDARAALRWVQKYVHLLGGDKDRVTIWGQSAGGGTVGHLIAAEAAALESDEKDALFSSAVLSSPYFVPMGSCNDTFWRVKNSSTAQLPVADGLCLYNPRISSKTFRVRQTVPVISNVFASKVPTFSRSSTTK